MILSIFYPEECPVFKELVFPKSPFWMCPVKLSSNLN